MAVASSSPYPYGARALAVVLLVAAIVTTAFWILWFLVPGGRDLLAVLPRDRTYITFENAFPVADEWMALCAAVGGVLLFLRRPAALAWIFMAGSAGIYLSGMDILYDFENGIYGLIGQNPSSVIIEIAICVATVTISASALWWAATHYFTSAPASQAVERLSVSRD